MRNIKILAEAQPASAEAWGQESMADGHDAQVGRDWGEREDRINGH